MKNQNTNSKLQALDKAIAARIECVDLHPLYIVGEKIKSRGIRILEQFPAMNEEEICIAKVGILGE